MGTVYETREDGPRPGRTLLHYSGCKVVFMKDIDAGTSDCHYSHALVAGFGTCHGQGENCQEVKVFCESLSLLSPHAHKVLCGYSLGQTVINKNIFRDPALKCEARCEAKVKFKERYKTSKNKLFLQKLQF